MNSWLLSLQRMSVPLKLVSCITRDSLLVPLGTCSDTIARCEHLFYSDMHCLIIKLDYLRIKPPYP
jgi:hypothetical protein